MSTRRNLENLSLLMGAVGFLLGGAIALLVVQPPATLFGKGSVGEVAALSGGLVAGAAFLTGVLVSGSRQLTWQHRLGAVRRFVDLAGLTLVHTSISLLATAAVFAVFADAFQRVELDRWAASFLVAGACAVAAYAAGSSANSMTTESLSLLVAAFMVVGAFASALTSSDPTWWQEHFSALGTASDVSGITFNFTLILTGVVLTTLADFLTLDLGRWARHNREPGWKVAVVRGALIIVGLMLAMVGVIPVNQSLYWHNMVTYAAVWAFVALLVGVPVLFRRLSRAFIGVSVVVAVLMGVEAWLNMRVGYLSTTGFEIAAVATVFVWLVLFIRTVSAAVADIPQVDDAPGATEMSST